MNLLYPVYVNDNNWYIPVLILDGNDKYSELYVTVCIPPVIIPDVPWGPLDSKPCRFCLCWNNKQNETQVPKLVLRCLLSSQRDKSKQGQRGTVWSLICERRLRKCEYQGWDESKTASESNTASDNLTWIDTGKLWHAGNDSYPNAPFCRYICQAFLSSCMPLETKSAFSFQAL